ncbi:Polyketide synthase modules and related proteins [Citrifermentans bremense]|uniref:Polyketide synthase modules and related proteins n=1 Tax=Citrifermentans bremense TaxID=60035 RepID=A0A6S6LUY9_9BACT|nr:amino acid adenylation domain-containing protein [Citrifermentans bremense]BCG45797.1 Polyketide synthase modules and related proteins [Citrifermentans bremense]
MYLLQRLLTESAATFPDNTAVSFRNQELSYAELEAQSNQLSALLKRRGVARGDRVGILLNKSLESIVSVFGILKAGAIYVPLDPAAPAARQASIIRHCGIEIAIAAPQLLERLVAEAEEPLPLRAAIVTGSSAGVLPPDQSVSCSGWNEMLGESSGSPADDGVCGAAPAYILHTSGSTGSPKGVVISHLNALTFVEMAARFFGISPRDRLANHAPLHFDLSIFDIFCAVKSGATVVLVPEALSAFPVRLADFMQNEGITVWNSVASLLTKLADQGALERLTLEKLRLVHFSGDLMPVKYLQTLKQCMPSAAFYNIYGQTEANSSLCFRVPDLLEQGEWKIPIGTPFPNFEVFAVDEGGKVVTEPGEEGELHVLSSTVALGYWNDCGRTQAQFAPDPRNPSAHARVYKTGDLARVDAAGNFVFAGRRDHMVKSKGFRVELDEIEIVLNSHPGVRQAAVVAVPDDLAGSRIVAYVCPREGATLEPRTLAALCSEHLPKYMVPELISCLASLPVNSNGKIDRKALERAFLEGAAD